MVTPCNGKDHDRKPSGPSEQGRDAARPSRRADLCRAELFMTHLLTRNSRVKEDLVDPPCQPIPPHLPSWKCWSAIPHMWPHIWPPSRPLGRAGRPGSPSSRRPLTWIGRSARFAATKLKGKCLSARNAAVNGGTRAQNWRRSSRLWTSTARRALRADATLPCNRLQLARSGPDPVARGQIGVRRRDRRLLCQDAAPLAATIQHCKPSQPPNDLYLKIPADLRNNPG